MDLLIAVGAVVAIGFICGTILAVASKVMAVEEDARFPIVRDCLPGANCGACGYAGCNEYTNALLSGEETRINLCIPGADAAARKLSEALDVPFQDVVEQVAVSCCRGCSDATSDKMDYQGMETCAAAKLLFGGKASCVYGCIGLGDCVHACPEGAIRIEDNLAVVNTSMCVGCTKCTQVCPNGLLQMVPDTARFVVHCKSIRKGAEVRHTCTNGCIGCKKCEKACPSDAIKVIDNLARIDYSKCTHCGSCVEVCPQKCIFEGTYTGAHNIAK
jgi:Na+-translocating ferredoxin:NAD+ oxidoreductase RNF subunit RnfB